MNLRTTTALALALIGTSAQAATRYDFSYTGLYYDLSWSTELDGFIADAAITGFFVGEDTSGDGTLTVDELTDFAFSYNYGIGSGELVHVIGPQVPEFCLRCQVDYFYYTPGETLTFDTVLSGVRYDKSLSNTGLWSDWYGEYWTLSVNPDTIIRVAEVPEPGTGLMFMTGLLGLAYLAKRKAIHSS